MYKTHLKMGGEKHNRKAKGNCNFPWSMKIENENWVETKGGDKFYNWGGQHDRKPNRI
jgi:hypothetical protein